MKNRIDEVGRKRYLLGLTSVLVLTLVASVAHAEEFDALVTSVCAGHVLRIGHDGAEELVVVNGITCPNSRTPAGARAKSAATKLAEKKTVRVRIVERLDKLTYANIELPNGDDLAHRLLETGLAVKYDRGGDPEQPLGEIQNEAQRDTQVLREAEPVASQRGQEEPSPLVNIVERMVDDPRKGAFRDENGQLHLRLRDTYQSTAHLDELRLEQLRRDRYAQRLWEQEAHEEYLFEQRLAEEDWQAQQADEFASRHWSNQYSRGVDQLLSGRTRHLEGWRPEE